MAALTNSRHEQFALLVARGASATSAYVEVGFMAKSINVAAVNGSRLLRTDKVASRVVELRAEQTVELIERLEVSREDITRRYMQIVNADPSELVAVRVAACRYCHGIDHAYQWRSEAEFKQAHAAWVKTRDAHKASCTPFGDPEPSSEGGFGYSRNLTPNANCEVCDGDGEPCVQTHASEGHPLFAGAKVTPGGQIEVRLVDRLAALEALGRIAGVFEKDNLQQGGPGSDLAAALLERMRQTRSLPVLNAGEMLLQAREYPPEQS